MAASLITRTSRDKFVNFIRTATEREAWLAIGDASHFVLFARISKTRRAELNRTLDQALAAYKQTFGEAWFPF